jgi:hypothetical protein
MSFQLLFKRMEDCYIRVSQIMENQRKGLSDVCVKVQKENLNIKAYLWGYGSVRPTFGFAQETKHFVEKIERG